VSASGNLLVMRPIVMQSKHPVDGITRGMPMQGNGFSNIKSNTTKAIGTDLMSELLKGAFGEFKPFLSGPTKARLESSIYSQNRKREQQGFSMWLTISFRSKARRYAGCTLKPTYRFSRQQRILGSSTSSVEDIVPYSVETRRRRIKSRCTKTLDMEFAVTRNQGSSAGSATVARSTAGVESWLTRASGAAMVGNSTSVGVAISEGSGYTTPGWTSGGSILAPTDASTAGTFTVTPLKYVIRQCWTAGGNPGVIMCGPVTKQTISGFAGIATIYREAGSTSKGTAIVGAADLYISDFGEHRVVPNRFMRDRTCLVLDMDYWKIAYLRKVSQKEIARTGAAIKRFIDCEFALVASNPQSSGKISDILAV
jgi:hypothetical protein